MSSANAFEIYLKNQETLNAKWDNQILVSIYPKEMIKQVPEDVCSRMLICVARNHKQLETT